MKNYTLILFNNIHKITIHEKWNNCSDHVKEAHGLLDNVRKLSLEISENDHRMDSKLSEYQRNKIYNSMEDLEQVISYLKNKIKHYESLEKIVN